MFAYFKRMVVAVESISESLVLMRVGQNKMLEDAKKKQEPEQILQTFEMVKKMMGGNKK